VLTYFVQDVYRSDGSSFKIPRMQSWMAESPYKVVKSLTQKQPALVWSEDIQALKKKIEEALDSRCIFDYVLINLYRDGTDSIGFHRDDEASGFSASGWPKNIIASVSLGEPRTFILQHKTDRNEETLKYRLPSGSLIVMDGETQEYYVHSVPKEPEITKPRINLTFRVG